MPKPSPVSIKTERGVRTFPSVADAALAFHKKPNVILRRLYRGWTPEQAVGIDPPPPKPPHVRSKPVVVKDRGRVRRFVSINAAAAAYGLPQSVVRPRLTKFGWTPEQALGLEPPPVKNTPPNAKPVVVIHKGRRRRFKSLASAAKAFQVNPQLVHKRWRLFGWTLNEALGIVPHKRRFVGRSQSVSFTHEGKRYRYKSILEACEAHGIVHGTVLSRLRSLGWTIRQALELTAPPAHTKDCYGFIYLVTHRASGRQYVGQTLLQIQDRWEEHIRSSEEANQDGPHLRCAIRKHGRRAFTIEEIDRTESFHDANKKERRWIKKLRTLTPHGFNMNRGGGGLNLGRPITVRGVRFDSIADAARAHGLSPLKVANRLRLHEWTPEQAVGLEPPPPRSGAPIEVSITVDGKPRTFPSIVKAAKALGLDSQTVSARIRACGWTVEQALELAPPPEREPPKGRPVTFVHNGRRFSYNSVKAAARAHGVKASLAGIRINKLGWTFAQAFELEPRPKQRGSRCRAIAFVHDGVSYRYPSVKKAAEEHGLKRSAVEARVRVGGWTYAQALGLDAPPETARRSDCALAFTHQGKKYRYDSVSDAAIAHDLKPGTVNARLRSGYTIQQALGLAEPPIRGRWVDR